MEISGKARELAKRLSKPDASKEDIAAYHELCREAPSLAWEYGSVTLNWRRGAIKRINASQLFKESLKANLAELEREMGGASAVGAERILIENVVHSWFNLQIAECRADAAINEGHSIKVQALSGHRLDSAHVRFHRAVLSLSQFRKVNVQIQINIAQNQVIAQSVSAGDLGPSRVDR